MGADVKFWTFVEGGGRGGGGGGGVTKIQQVRTRDEGISKFWSFCDNVIIECPHTRRVIIYKYEEIK